MDIKVTDSLLRQYLDTSASATKIAKALSLCGPTVDQLEKTENDYIYHIEAITNRVDTASAFGVAREANAILPQFGIKSRLTNNPYQSQKQLTNIPSTPPVSVSIADPSLVTRFTCIAISGVGVKPSPQKTVKLLENAGERSLNNLIDITNELTLKYGQPTHIFDLDRIKKQKMLVRESHKGEKLITLDGKTHQLPGKDIVIEDGEGRLIDLCGIMGGDLSAITDKTKNVLLFVQTYEPKHIRRTSLALQTRTLAAQLFEKRTDPELVLPVLIEGVELILERAGGKISSSILDIYPKPSTPTTVNLDLNWLDQFSGIKIPKKQVVSILEKLGFPSEEKNNSLICTVPSWRIHDISIREDLAEEIVRVYGYYRLPSVIPATNIPAIGTDTKLNLEQKTRSFMASLGFTEIYNYSLVSKTLLEQTGFRVNNLFKLQNPLSEDFEFMRPSLIPSILQNLDHNRGTVKLPVQIFELSNVYHQIGGEILANEIPTLAFATLGQDFRYAKGYLETIFNYLHLEWNLKPVSEKEKTFQPESSAHIFLKDGTKVGIFGYPREDITTLFHLPTDTIIGELNFKLLSDHASLIKQFTPISTTTAIIEDLTFTLPTKTSVGLVIDTINSTNKLISNVELKDIYEQNHTFTISYLHKDQQLTTTDIEPVRKEIVTTLASKHEAKLVGNL